MLISGHIEKHKSEKHESEKHESEKHKSEKHETVIRCNLCILLNMRYWTSLKMIKQAHGLIGVDVYSFAVNTTAPEKSKNLLQNHNICPFSPRLSFSHTNVGIWPSNGKLWKCLAEKQ